MVKTVLAVHDIVTMGRCSLTVVIPTLSMCGIKVCPLPTAVLSSDTGDFGAVYLSDLTEQMPPILDKLYALRPKIDAVYSGYLGSPEQAGIVRHAAEHFKAQGALVVVDPVMGDGGKLYANIGQEMVEAMRLLSACADVITPNYTEACYLLGQPVTDITDDTTLLVLAQRLSLLCGNFAVTSVPRGKATAATLLRRATGEVFLLEGMRYPAHFPGTGDLFAALLTAGLLDGATLMHAAAKASVCVGECIRFTMKAGTPVREGVLLEAVLPGLLAEEVRLNSLAEGFSLRRLV